MFYGTNNPTQGSFELCLNFPRHNEEGYKKGIAFVGPPSLCLVPTRGIPEPIVETEIKDGNQNICLSG